MSDQITFPELPLERWAAAARRDRNLLVRHFHLPGDALPGWSLLDRIDNGIQYGARHFIYMYGQPPAGAEVLLRVDVLEAASWPAAHLSMAQFLKAGMLPLLPEAREPLPAGVAAYTDLGAKGVLLQFLRANLVVRVTSAGFTDTTVLAPAKSLDKRATQLPDATQPPAAAPLVRAEALGKEDRWRIRVDDPLGQEVTLKVVAPSHEVEIAFVDDVLTVKGSPAGIRIIAVNARGMAGAAQL